jgi:hypothetical protein
VTRDESHVSVGVLLALGYGRKAKNELHGRHINQGRVEVGKEAEKKEKRKEKLVIGREDRGR